MISPKQESSWRAAVKFTRDTTHYIFHYKLTTTHYKLTTRTTNSLQIHYKSTTIHYKSTTIIHYIHYKLVTTSTHYKLEHGVLREQSPERRARADGGIGYQSHWETRGGRADRAEGPVYRLRGELQDGRGEPPRAEGARRGACLMIGG